MIKAAFMTAALATSAGDIPTMTVHDGPSTLVFTGGNTEPLLVFHPDGTVTGNKSLKPDDAAKQILDLVYKMAADYRRCEK